MKIRLLPNHRGTGTGANIYLSDYVLDLLGWAHGDGLSLDIPLTGGGGLRITKESDPISVMGGVREVVNG